MQEGNNHFIDIITVSGYSYYNYLITNFKAGGWLI